MIMLSLMMLGDSIFASHQHLSTLCRTTVSTVLISCVCNDHASAQIIAVFVTPVSCSVLVGALV